MITENYFELKSESEWRYDYPYRINYKDGKYYFVNREYFPLTRKSLKKEDEFNSHNFTTEQLEALAKVLEKDSDGGLSYYDDRTLPWYNKECADNYMEKVRRVRLIIGSREN